MFIAVFKTLLIFARTLYYLCISFKKNCNLLELKQQWALSVLNELGVAVRVIDHHCQKRNLVFVGNHIGFLDIIVLIAIEPRIVFLSKAEVAKWPIIGAGAKRIGVIFVNRESSHSRAASKEAIFARLNANDESVYIAGFPSGTTCLHEELPWKKGLFEIAQTTNTDVQSFKLKYSPLRPCAYIDDDTLFGSLMGLFKTENKKVILEWGNSFQVSNLTEQIEATRQWTQTALNFNDDKAPVPAGSFVRPSSSF